MKALSIGWVNVKRLFRERSNIFFVFIFPIAIVLLVGLQFGGDFRPAVGLTSGDDGEIATAIEDALVADGSLDVEPYESDTELIAAIERGAIQAGLLLPADMDSDAAAGVRLDFEYVSRPDGAGPQLQSIVSAIIAEVMAPVGAAQFADVETGAGFAPAFVVARGVSEQVEPIGVEVRSVGESLFPDTMGQFDLGASSQLVLFVFLTALAGSAALILTRKLGISKRMLSTPTRISSIIVGESLGRFGTALVQGIYIIVLTFVIFRVSWGDPLGAFLLLVALSAVGAGAGMLLGSVFDNDEQAGGVGVVLSLGLAALGGAMVPSELFSPTMRTIAHMTPHAWALDGFAVLIRHDGSTLDILPQLGVLAIYAIVLLSLAAWRLRIAITRP